jgi:GMP synthase-like glutamine amidotransferase
MHIGILVTNTDESEFAQRHPKDGEKFRALLQPFAQDWVFTAVQVKDGEFPTSVDQYDGYVIGGSPASANGDAPWIVRLMEFIRALDTQKTPTIGVCFGHQAIARALGGKVAKNTGGWGFGVAGTDFVTQENWMVPRREHLNLYAAHSEQVVELPKNAVLLGGSDFCPLGSYRIGNHIFTTEYHPEMTKEFICALTNEYASYLGPDIATRAIEQIKIDADGDIFAQWMMGFLALKR